jgi:hypothetical protein
MIEWISWLIWGIMVLAISWGLGNTFIDQIGLPVKFLHLVDNSLIIFLVGFVALILFWIVLKVFI